mgnify:FL=1
MFKFYNRHPGHRKLPDCVCRAISLALRMPYYEVMDMLIDNGVCYDCDELTVKCYSKLLNELGYIATKVENKTVQELAKENSDDILLVRIEGHLTCCINGECYDIWDCSERNVDMYWVIR